MGSHLCNVTHVVSFPGCPLHFLSHQRFTSTILAPRISRSPRAPFPRHHPSSTPVITTLCLLPPPRRHRVASRCGTGSPETPPTSILGTKGFLRTRRGGQRRSSGTRGFVGHAGRKDAATNSPVGGPINVKVGQMVGRLRLCSAKLCKFHPHSATGRSRTHQPRAGAWGKGWGRLNGGDRRRQRSWGGTSSNLVLLVRSANRNGDIWSN